MLCDWCDERIVDETGEYKTVWLAGLSREPERAVRWDELHFHDYCYEDGTRGYYISETELGELLATPKTDA